MFNSSYSAPVLAALRQLNNSGRVRTELALERVAKRLSLSTLDVHEAVRDLYYAGFLQYQADNRGLPVSGFITVAKDEVVYSQIEVEWGQALDDLAFSPEAKSVLVGLAPKLSDLNVEDLGSLAAALKKLSESGMDNLNDAGFNVSARNLMGSSKVLSQLSQKMLQILGLPLRLQNPSPKYVICAGPASPEATVLIENPLAFENAIRSGLAESNALVCTFGFGLSYLGQEWLHDDETAEHDKPIAIIRSGTPPPLDELLTLENVFLWADLDPAAINIYLSLKRAIPHLRLSKIYEAMVPMLANLKTSHPYAILFDKVGQNKKQNTGRCHDFYKESDVLALLHSCLDRGVDQEAVDVFNIRSLGGLPYMG